MELIIKHFNELTTEELMQIYRLRIGVFVSADCFVIRSEGIVL